MILFAVSPGTIKGVITVSITHAGTEVPVTALVGASIAVGFTWVLNSVCLEEKREGWPPVLPRPRAESARWLRGQRDQPPRLWCALAHVLDLESACLQSMRSKIVERAHSDRAGEWLRASAFLAPSTAAFVSPSSFERAE